MMKLLFGGVVAAAVTAGALHLRLTDSLPKANATITEAPSEIRVWFNQEPRLPVSRLGLAGPDGDVAMGRAEAAEGKSFKAAVLDSLTAGEYTVSWRTAGDDGHVRRGTFTFTLAPEQGH